MKLNINNKNLLIAEAQTSEESLELMQLAHGKKSTVEGVKRKVNLIQKCHLCNGRYKGLMGLAIHMRGTHNMSLEEANKTRNVPVESL